MPAKQYAWNCRACNSTGAYKVNKWGAAPVVYGALVSHAARQPGCPHPELTAEPGPEFVPYPWASTLLLVLCGVAAVVIGLLGLLR